LFLGYHAARMFRRAATIAEGLLNGVERLLGARVLERYGSRIALLCGEQAITYAELAAQVRAASAAVRAFGVAPGDRVLLLMRDTPQFAAAWLGAVRAGAVAVALNNRLSEADYRHIVADSAGRLVVVEDVLLRARPGLGSELAAQSPIAVVGDCPPGTPSWDAACAQASAAPTLYAAQPESPAFMLYSSGTTGRPKGIVHTHRAFDYLGAAFKTLGIGEGDRIFSTSKFFFAYGLEHGLLAPLASGATAVLVPDWPEADAVIAAVTRHQPAVLFSVPTTYRRLLAEPPGRLAAFASIRRFVAAGERLTPQLAEHWQRGTGGELLNLYGMSETFCACMMTGPGESDGVRTGRPFPGVEVRLLPPEPDETVGGTAVLWVRHPAQARGYLNLARETDEQFQDGWFCSRDLFRRDDAGFYVHQGRSDELLKVAGQWVQPGELEEVAVREPSVAEAACVPVEDADGMLRLALFVTARREAHAAEREAAAACERALPRHKRPKWVRAVAELPRTATGKVQRYKLREILELELRRGR
jgi:3-hydroxybenzoate/4-hydroxybenzoate---CoA ligase